MSPIVGNTPMNCLLAYTSKSSALTTRRFLIEVLALQALLHEERGDEPSALAAIEKVGPPGATG